MSSGEVFDSLRLSQAEVEDLIAELNRATAKAPQSTRRELKRWPMQHQRCVLTTSSKLMGNMHGVAYPRNLAKKGAAVLTGAFVHPGTTCHLTLRSIDGSARSIPGVIRWCRHVKARAHDLGIQFASAVNPRDFFIEQEGQCLFQLERVEVTNLRGTLVIVDEDRLTHRLFQDLLGTSSVELVFAMTGEEGLKLLDQSPALIVAENALPDMSGLDFLLKVRGLGFRTPIILMAREGDAELRLAAIGGGAQELLLRPVTPETILRGVAEYLGPEAVSLSKAGDGGTSSASAEVLLDLSRKALKLVESGDIAGARSTLIRIATTAREFRVVAVAEQAERASAAAMGESAQPRLLAEVRGLARACESLATAKAA